jgi:23S rRNA (cytosine1962-C5)-methyltransferase
MLSIRLHPGREKSLLRRHPWIFSGAISDLDGTPKEGETVQVLSSGGEFLAWAAYSPHSQIRARVWSWDKDEIINEEFFHRRLERSLSRRSALCLDALTDAQRLVHAESDGLPGLIVDRYVDVLVIQLLTCGVEYWRGVLVDELARLTGVKWIYERSDADIRQLEGLPARSGFVYTSAHAPTDFPGLVTIKENGLQFFVDIRQGHKTGFYLDQRENRLTIRRYAEARHALDCFCYTGGVALSMLAGGAQTVLAIDASSSVLDLAHENLKLNSLPSERITWLQSDVFKALRSLRDQGRTFDLVVLDPPKFAQTEKQVQQAARGYKDINLLAFKLLQPGGILFTFSCSGGVSVVLFQKIVAGAALDADVEACIVEYLHQAPDHPVALNFPEGAYLKGLVVQVNS